MSSDIDDPPMSLVAHLTELRDRLLRCVLAVLVAFIVPFMYANEIYLFVSEPLRALLPPGTSMIATEVAAPFLVPFKLSVVTAIFIVVPYILFQAWGFIAPGLYRHEKRFAIPILVSSILLFYAGVAFAYYLVFPLVFNFFASVIPADIAYTPDINHYLDIVLKLFFAFGLAFEIPIATVLMIRTGITSPATLSAKRPYIIVGCFVVAMLLTPPDVFSQILLAVPMWLLFESGLWLGRWFERDKVQDEETGDESEDAAEEE